MLVMPHTECVNLAECFDAPYLELSLNMRQKIREHIYYSQFRCSLSGAFFKSRSRGMI